MKKAKLILIALLVAALCIAVFGCGKTEPQPEPQPEQYTVTVNGGSADKTSAKEGETITLTCGAAPTGKEFLHWTVNGDDITGNTFEMPAEDVTVVAVFDFIDYTVSVTGGSADKTTAHYGDTVTLTANAAPSGKEFSHWTVNDEQISGNTFEMPAEDVTVVAVFEFVDYTISVTGGSADKTTAHYGDIVTLTADTAPIGKEFLNWTVNDEQISGNTFDMPAENVTVVAVFDFIDYKVSVTGGIADKTTAHYGDIVTLTANAAPSGKEFSHWTVNDEQISGNTFDMPANNVSAVAVYADKQYNINVVGGSANIQKAKAGDTVTLTLDDAQIPTGERFIYWTVNDEQISGNTFEMPAEDVTVNAVFEFIDYTVSVTGGTASTATAHYGDTVTLTPDQAGENEAFSHWTVNGEKIEGNSFEMPAANVTAVAVFIDLVRKIETPDNSEDKLIYAEKETSPCPVALDRVAGKTMFKEYTDHVLFYIYDSATAQTDESLGTFKMIRYPEFDGLMNSGIISSMDGTLTIPINGSPGNYYFASAVWNGFFDIIRHEIGYEFSLGKAYYFAAQVKAVSEPLEESGFDITYTDSDISAIGTTGIAKDKNADSGKYTVTVDGGYIDGDKATVTAGYGYALTLTADTIENYTFTGWYKLDAESQPEGDPVSMENTFVYTVTENVSLKAVFVKNEELVKTPLATPDNSESKLIYKEPSGSIALDRSASGSIFGPYVQSAIFNIYTAADSSESVGSFRVTVEYGKPSQGGAVTVGSISSIDGSLSYDLIYGDPNNYYIIDTSKFYEILADAIGYKYSDGQTYYFAAQSVAYEDSLYSDSQFSQIGAEGFARNPDVGTETYTVTLLDGKIDGNLTTVEAGYGVKLSLSAEMPEDKDVFRGWKVVTLGAEGEEIYGETISTQLSFVYTVTSSITLRPVFYNSSEVEFVKLEAPDNSADQMIKFKVGGNVALIEYDRQTTESGESKTAFAEGVDHLECYIYDSKDDAAEPVGSFKIVCEADKFYLSTMDGSGRFELSGEKGKLYSESGNAQNLIKSVISGYNNDTEYYYAFKAVAAYDGLYLDSDIGTKGSGWASI